MAPLAPAAAPSIADLPLPPATGDEEGERRFRQFAEVLPGICWLADADGRGCWLNAAGRDFFGGDARAIDPLRAIHPDDYERVMARWRDIRRTGEADETTLRQRGRDGRWRTFLSRTAPVRDASGRIDRWCGVLIDVTERHVHDRRQAMLRAFLDAGRDLDDPAAVLGLLADTIFGEFGVDRVIYGEAIDGDDARYTLFRAVRGGPFATATLALTGRFHRALLAVGRRGRALVSEDEALRPSPLMTAARQQGLALAVRAAIMVPIIRDGRIAACLALLVDRPRRWSADEVELCEELAERVWTIVDRVRTQRKLRERERHQRFLIEWGDALRRRTDPDAIMRATLERLGRHLGVTRTTYSEADEVRRAFTTRWDWCDDCASLVGTRVFLAQVSEEVEREWLSDDLVRYDDVATDPRLGAADRAVHAAHGVAAFVSIPLIRHGEVRSVLSVQSAVPRAWLPSEIDLIRDMGERTWVALERARAQAELLERERNQAFLIDWGDRVRTETRAEGILDATLERLGQHLGASRAVWAAIHDAGDAYSVVNEWRREVSSTLGVRFPADTLSATVRALYLAGQPLVSDDLRADDRLSDAARTGLIATEVVARIGVPLSRDGRVQAILAIDCTRSRRWTRDEVQLVRQVAERVWALIQKVRSEERLAESEALLAAFMEHAPLGMSLKDAEGRFLRINPELARQIGTDAGSAAGRLPGAMLAPDAASRMAALAAAARGGTMASAEFLFPDRADYAALLAVEFPIGGGGAARTGGFTLDLTARKAAEAELARSREALYQTEKLSALGSLLAGVSHELNNPLSIVVAQAVMLERQGEGTVLAERAFKIRKAADRCARIVQTFLAMARQKRPERGAVDLNAVATAALELAGYGLAADRIVMVERFEPALPRIAADADQIHQIIVNLVVNAHQAMTDVEGERVLRVTTGFGPEPQTVMLEVADTGAGIPPDLARRIFEPFFTTKPQGEGTGVGLSFSLGLAEAHGGRLQLVPAARGACFRLTLPIDAGVALPRVAPEPAPAPALPVRRALVVDDEPEIAEALADFLSIEGFRCTLADGGEAACGMLADGGWDLVVSDLRMPGMDGLDLHGWIGQRRPDLIPRLGFVTGDTLGASVADFLRGARRPVLEKPFTPDAVRQFVEQFGA